MFLDFSRRVIFIPGFISIDGMVAFRPLTRK